VLLLAVTLPSRADDSSKPAPAASGDDSWAPLSHAAPPSTPDSASGQPDLVKAPKYVKGSVDHPPPGFHDMKLSGGGVVRVSDAPVGPGGEFGRTSSFADKTFSAQDSSLSHNMEAPEMSQKAFLTSAFGTSNYTNSDHTFRTAAYHTDARSSDDFTKAYTLPAGADSFARPFETKPSSLQDKTALIGQQALSDPFSTPWSEGDKKFYDPALRKIKRDPYAGDSLDVSRLTNLPNRPLTIDEVRALINHEQIPDLNAKPDEPSRPLNDPNWEPPLKLPEISDKAAPAPPPPDEAKDGELPSPGMMAQPGAAGAVPTQK
jgi:hypothetical protein